jgi:hypothetical protein
MLFTNKQIRLNLSNPRSIIELKNYKTGMIR